MSTFGLVLVVVLFVVLFFGGGIQRKLKDVLAKRSNRRLGDMAANFVDATDGGWYDTPKVVSADGGNYTAYVAQQLEFARSEAMSLPVGAQIEYTLRGVPRGIHTPHDIVFGMMMKSEDYGLRFEHSFNETFAFTKIA